MDFGLEEEGPLCADKAAAVATAAVGVQDVTTSTQITGESCKAHANCIGSLKCTNGICTEPPMAPVYGVDPSLGKPFWAGKKKCIQDKECPTGQTCTGVSFMAQQLDAGASNVCLPANEVDANGQPKNY